MKIHGVKAIKKINTSQLSSFGFACAALWAISSALYLSREYQDSWVLDGIIIQFAILSVFYLLTVCVSFDIRRIAIVTSTMAFLLSVVPALKYMFVYNSTVDTAVHISSIRTIASTGQIDPLSAYVNTPGFHSLIAVLAQLSGTGVETWSKLISSLLGGLTPLAFYMTCQRISIPIYLARIIIIFSGLCLPVLYILEGTGFTLPIFVFVVLFFFIREMNKTNVHNRVVYTLLLLLFVCGVIFWHPSTSLVAPAILMFAGLALEIDYKNTLFLKDSRSIITLGTMIIVATFCYWMYSADYVWSKFAKNVMLVIHPYSTPNLVPKRLFEIKFIDQMIIGLSYHARDGIVLAFVILGLFMLFKKESNQFLRFMRTFGLLWFMSVVPVILVFIAGFGAQGYKRFLSYVIVLSPILAGYGLWRIGQLVRNHISWIPENGVVNTGLLLTFVISLIQLYPYQPGLPISSSTSSGLEKPPILWMHQVNTTYQYDMLDFAYHKLPQDIQLIADYIGYQQSALFFGSYAKNRIHQIASIKPEPMFILLHKPGEAGGYMEQAEYRSLNAIQELQNLPNMDMIYDNGDSFILYFPKNSQELSSLRNWK